jgi:hypothetical protein
VASASRRLASAVLIALPLAVCSTAQAHEWVRVGTDSEDNSYSVDTSQVVHDGSIVSVRVRTEYARPRKVEAVSVDVFAALDHMVIDCGKASFAVQSRTLVAADGSEIPRGSTARANLRFRAAAEGSMSESIVRFACQPAADGSKK